MTINKHPCIISRRRDRSRIHSKLKSKSQIHLSRVDRARKELFNLVYSRKVSIPMKESQRKRTEDPQSDHKTAISYRKTATCQPDRNTPLPTVSRERGGGLAVGVRHSQMWAGVLVLLLTMWVWSTPTHAQNQLPHTIINGCPSIVTPQSK